MSALFNFDSFFRLLILLVCTSTYVKRKFPSLIARREGLQSAMYKCCVVGDRLSPYIASFCFLYSFQKFIKVFL